MMMRSSADYRVRPLDPISGLSEHISTQTWLIDPWHHSKGIPEQSTCGMNVILSTLLCLSRAPTYCNPNLIGVPDPSYLPS